MTNNDDCFNLITNAFIDPVLGQNLQCHALFSQPEFRAPLKNAIFHFLKHLSQLSPFEIVARCVFRICVSTARSESRRSFADFGLITVFTPLTPDEAYGCTVEPSQHWSSFLPTIVHVLEPIALSSHRLNAYEDSLSLALQLRIFGNGAVELDFFAHVGNRPCRELSLVLRIGECSAAEVN
jgi:hypothetical protein